MGRVGRRSRRRARGSRPVVGGSRAPRGPIRYPRSLATGRRPEQARFAFPGLVARVYQPAFTGILPVFVVCMALLPAFLWLDGCVGAWALLPPVALWAAVQVDLIATPSVGGRGSAFDMLAWPRLAHAPA